MIHILLSFDKVHMDREFVTYNSIGHETKWQGAWIITDNDFSLQCPDHHATHHDEVMFAEWLESMRPCVRILNAPLEEFSNNAFVY